jgi:phosphoribosylanthranilate isomerase
VKQAVQRVTPIGVDVKCGVEDIPGKKDKLKVLSFIQNSVL